MRFTIRETNIYLGQVPLILAKSQMTMSNCWDYKEEGFAYICYPIILFALSLLDREKYTDYVLGTIEEIYNKMLEEGSTTVWETTVGQSDFGNAGSLCHGWSAMPVYYYHTLLGEE